MPVEFSDLSNHVISFLKSFIANDFIEFDFTIGVFGRAIGGQSWSSLFIEVGVFYLSKNVEFIK